MEAKIDTENGNPKILVKVVVPDLNSDEEKVFLFSAYIAPDQECNLMHKNLPFKIAIEGERIEDFAPDFENVTLSIDRSNIANEADWSENPEIKTTLYAYTGSDNWLIDVLEDSPIVLGQEFVSQFTYYDNSEDDKASIVYFKSKKSA